MVRYKEESQEFWQRHVESFKHLTISKAAYASANGLDKARWVYWSRKLMKVDSGFMPVKLSSSVSNNSAVLLTIDCPQGLRISVYHSAILGQLPSLLSALSK